jgi:hypothetical protein
MGVALHLRKSGGNPPKRPKISRRAPSYPHPVVFYAVVSDEIHQVIEFFSKPAEAESMLETVRLQPLTRSNLGEPVEASCGRSFGLIALSRRTARKRHAGKQLARHL